MRTSIIIPVHNNHEFTLACLESVRENTRDYEVIIVDNGSEIPFDAPGVKIVRNEANPGFSAAANQGIREASGELIVFLNNDAIVTPDWIEHLAWHLDNGFDLVGPVSNSVAGPQWIPPRMIEYHYTDGVLGSLDKVGLYKFSSDFHDRYLHAHRPHFLLVGFLTALKRTTLDRMGNDPWDSAFGFGSFEDDDFCLRAIEAGLRLGIAQDVFIHHWGSVTLKSVGVDIDALFRGNSAIFNAKWPEEKQTMLKAMMTCE